jgi:hypothetical protein
MIRNNSLACPGIYCLICVNQCASVVPTSSLLRASVLHIPSFLFFWQAFSFIIRPTALVRITPFRGDHFLPCFQGFFAVQVTANNCRRLGRRMRNGTPRDHAGVRIAFFPLDAWRLCCAELGPMADVSSFGHSDLIRHSNFGIRHWVAGAAGDGSPW